MKTQKNVDMQSVVVCFVFCDGCRIYSSTYSVNAFFNYYYCSEGIFL